MTHRGLIALSGREVKRVLKLWTQAVLAPILSSSLFILVFGLSLGVTAAIAALSVGWSAWLFATGRRLKP